MCAVVVNWQGEHYLPRCLDALLAQEPAPSRVIVVDNHSSDRSRELVAGRYPRVRLFDLGANLGPGPARNRGVELADDELVLCLDNDVELRPGALAALVRELHAHPQAAAVQARSLLADAAEPTLHYDAADLHYLGLMVLRDWYRPLAAAGTAPSEVGSLVSLCFLVRRQAFVAVGGFDPRYFFFFEDTDFAWRLRLAGWRLRHAPDALVVHHGGTAGLSVRGRDATFTDRRAYYHSRNRWLLLLTCMHWRTLLLTMPMQVAYAAIHLAFAVAQGHGLAWLRGKLRLLRELPAAWRRRRQVQRTRRVADRTLLGAWPLTLNPHVARGGVGAALRRAMDLSFAAWWRLVGWACG